MDFRLPALGEGIDSATVVRVLVEPGAAVKAGQDVLEVETDKASVSVPVDRDATVESVAVKPGDKIAVGGVVLKLAGSAPASSKPASPPSPAKSESRPASPTEGNGPASPPPAAPTAPKRVEFRLPELGEGIEGGTVVNVAVKPGDAVAADQTLLDVETDKASMSIPAPSAGKVEEVRVKSGDAVKVGQVVAVLILEGAGSTKPPTPSTGQRAAASAPPSREASTADSADSSRPAPPATNGASGDGRSPAPAGPATRRLARELGVDLHQVPGSGRGGRVTIDDVKGFVRTRLSAPVAAPGPGPFAVPPLPDFSKYGAVERKAVSGLRKKIAENLTIAWRTCPMVTQHDLADVTELEAGRKRISEGQEKGKPKVTMTVLAMKACVAALREFPHFNASYDAAAGELIYKRYYHLGIAVDTERGLVVPVVRDVDKKSVHDLAREVAEVAEKARTGKLAVDDMRGGTFTISNLGGIGGTAFTPIVNWPEVAILGLARSSLQPVVRDGQVEPRLMMPLCLTYDHRVVDGADGARFTTKLVKVLSDPIRLLMEG